MTSITRTVGRAGAWLLLACAAMPTVGFAAEPGGSTFVAGHARFEFLTPSLLRMEYSPSGAFVDEPTAVVQKRDWPAVAVRSAREHGWLVLRTDAMTVRYRLQSGPFTAGNLAVSWKNDPAGAGHAWHPGDVDRHNLGGLTYSLDNISRPNLPGDGKDLASPVNDIIPGIDVLLAPAKPGLLSRSGYALIDDSRTPVWNAQTAWIEPRKDAVGQDWYLFTYHHDYERVLQEYAELCGPIPMIPRYTLGSWITDFNFEYFPATAETRQPAFRQYDEQHLKDEISRFRQNHIPLDILVLDFAWHNYGWQGGYDWSPLIAHPGQLLDWLHGQGIKVGLNDHPGYANTRESILSYQDSHAPAVLRDLGRPLPPAPSFDMDVAASWALAIDPRNQGIDQRWFLPGQGDGQWKPVSIGAAWQAQGYPDYRGVAWYRRSVRLPAHLPGALYLYLGEVSKSYRLFVNGHEVTHSQVQWPRRLTYADIAPYARAGKDNAIALRVESGPVGGGILRGPVALRDVKPPPRIYFDLSNKVQAATFMRDLHQPLMQRGVDFWWVDGGSGATDMPGLNKQLWTNKVFYDDTQQAAGPHGAGKRGFILGRYGDWGSERYPGYFTGDTYSEWPVLAYEVALTTRGGNVLVPYISHDIGGFHGAKIDFDLYARWVEFGTFSPFLRMHSAHEDPREGNLRMPWTYGSEGMALVRKYFTLRTRLIPYIYTYTWIAHRESLPILRPLYLQYPDLQEAYQHPHEYFFGGEMLVAPVLDASGNRTVYLPPGRWLDFFTGKPRDGAGTFTAHYAVDQTPVFVREGSIIPEQPADMAWSDARPLDRLVLNVYGSGKGHFDLYEDDGVSLAYEKGRYAVTPMTYATARDGSHRLLIGPSKGSFDGQVRARSYEVRIHDEHRPHAVSLDGRPLDRWSWDAGNATTTIVLPERSLRGEISVGWR
ncbi:MAG TPA: TIM-barrel domain-containing protein [Rhodanobacter sp.]|nr:TIM-barrel domain-containing protein [Rhodanobacter sp.]